MADVLLGIGLTTMLMVALAAGLTWASRINQVADARQQAAELAERAALAPATLTADDDVTFEPLDSAPPRTGWRWVRITATVEGRTLAVIAALPEAELAGRLP
jgi:hypothetical protein